MRSLLPVPFSLAALLLLALCASLVHVHVYFHEAVAAVVACTGASLMALLPSQLIRADGQVAIRLGLLGTVIHMFGCLAFAGLLFAMGLTGERIPFTCWLLACYWISLTVLAVVIVRKLRRTAHVDSARSTPSEGLA